MGACPSTCEAQVSRLAYILLPVTAISRGADHFPAKTHARKVKDELIGLVPRVSTEGGLIYLPGQGTIPYEDSDGEAPFRQRR